MNEQSTERYEALATLARMRATRLRRAADARVWTLLGGETARRQAPKHAQTSAERELLARSPEVRSQLRMSRVGERETYIAEPEAPAPRVSAAAKHAAKRKEMSTARDAMDREFAAIYAAKKARSTMTANKSGYRMER